MRLSLISRFLYSKSSIIKNSIFDVILFFYYYYGLKLLYQLFDFYKYYNNIFFIFKRLENFFKVK